MNPNTKPQSLDLKRRNSTSTIFLANTMTTQDNEATIECVCVVIRTYMIDAAEENVIPLVEFDVFKDASFIHPSPMISSSERHIDTIAHNLSMVGVACIYTSSSSPLPLSSASFHQDCLIPVGPIAHDCEGVLCIRVL